MHIQTINPFTKSAAVLTDKGLQDENGNIFPFKNGAYRIVTNSNYTNNFGYQWNKFDTAQMDKSSELDLSKNRFFAVTGWDKEQLKDKNILEVGSGAGRFTQIVLDYTDADLYSVDYSNAVDANFRNNGPDKRLKLFQASIYELPFAKKQFDKVFCFGVLQHTPDVQKSVRALIDMVKPGGELVVDFYPVKGWWTKLHAKYLLRPFTKKLGHDKLYKKIDRNIDWLISTYRFFSKAGVGRLLNRFLPICDIDATLPKNLSYKKLRELCVLDTFDMYSPQYDQPQQIRTVAKWFNKFDMTNVWSGFVKYENYNAAIVKGINS